MDFVPTQRYIDKGLKPERITLDDVVKLANAYRIAEESDVLPKDSRLRQLFLANALAENRPQNFGVNSYEPYLSSDRTNNLSAMGLMNRISFGGENEVSRIDPVMPKRMIRNAQGKTVPDWKDPLGYEGNDINSRMAAFIFRDKLDKARGDPLKAIERWNGKGKSYDVEGNVIADAKNHLRKVMAVDKLMSDPRNARILQIFNKARSGLIEYP